MLVMPGKKDKSNIAVLNANIDSLEKEVIHLRRYLGGFQNENALLKHKLASQEAYIHQKNHDYRNLEEKVRRERGKKNEMEKSLNRAMKGIEHNSRDEIIETLKEDIKRLQGERDDRQRKISELKADLNQLQTKLSKIAGDKMLDGNPGITDLSDPYRPQKLVEMVSILYDNKWTEAFENLEHIAEEKQKCIFLLDLFKASWTYCGEILEKQSKELEKVLLLSTEENKEDALCVLPPECSKLITDIRKMSAHEMIQRLLKGFELVKPDLTKNLQPYVESCLEICWYSIIFNPPLEFVFKADEQPEDFRKYTQGGKSVDFVVWPAMYLYANGPILNKGVAQFTD